MATVLTDPRIQHKYLAINGQTYHFLLGTPSGTPKATIFLIHGWPDFSYGWRNQIPLLLSLNLRVVVPDMMGYGQTSAPQSLEHYTFKQTADDMAALAFHLNVPEIILLGHDWGGSIVWRIALWKPKLVSAVISICTPYDRPAKEFLSIEEVVKGKLPQFRYQLHLASGEVEERVKTKEEIKQFLNALHGAKSKNGEVGFTSNGPIYENFAKLERTPLMDEDTLDYYAENFARNGMRGTVNWYRTRQLNFRDERELAKIKDLKIRVPVLYVCATRDIALPPWMSRGMERNFTNYRRAEVDAGHWALTQKSDECNQVIGSFLKEVLEGKIDKSKL
jgi:soluble epoxide hydrolase/lipid-phosphate phosphatase